jgi:serine/threonine-protein kinase
MLLRRFTSSAVLFAALVASPAVRADDRATAQELFQQAKDLIAAGKMAEACAKFAAASELSQTAGVRLNLASCYEKIGRTASAWTRYDEALTIAERSGDSAAAQLAKDGQAALKGHLSYLSVAVSKDAAAVPDLDVLRDGQRVPRAAWGVSVPVDPGEHEIKAVAPAHKAWTTTTKVAGEGMHAEVQVPVLAVEDAPTPIAPAAATAPAEQAEEPSGLFSGRGGTQRITAVVSAGVGVVALGIGGAFGAQMLSKKSDYQSHQGSAGQCLDAQCASSSSAAISDGNVATVGFIAGGVLVAAGAVLWLTSPRSASKPTAAAIVPVAGPRVAGVGIEGSW